jgi:hypothetical protein
MNNAMLSENRLHRILSTSLSTCTTQGPYRCLTSCQPGGRQVWFQIHLTFHVYGERIQADLRYYAQIRSIIVVLSPHVVVLIKDLNGNHVIQNCLNKRTPEDNQVREYFILTILFDSSFTMRWLLTVLKSTHHYGCCVLQRCIDRASDH